MHRWSLVWPRTDPLSADRRGRILAWAWRSEPAPCCKMGRCLRLEYTGDEAWQGLQEGEQTRRAHAWTAFQALRGTLRWHNHGSDGTKDRRALVVPSPAPVMHRLRCTLGPIAIATERGLGAQRQDVGQNDKQLRAEENEQRRCWHRAGVPARRSPGSSRGWLAAIGLRQASRPPLMAIVMRARPSNHGRLLPGECTVGMAGLQLYRYTAGTQYRLTVS